MDNLSSACWLIKFSVADEMPEDLNNFCEEYFDVVAVNYNNDGSEEVVCYKSLQFEENDMLAQARLYNVRLPDYKIEYLESKNWLTENVIKFSPFEVGNFIVYGSHEKSAPESDKIPVQVYAATAFGSEHQTTFMCLEAMSELFNKGFIAKKILDVGTGSGILSIAAAKQWKKSLIKAVDIDEEAVEVSRQNSCSNGTDNQVVCLKGDGYQLPEITNFAPYDLILTNIFARPLISMAPQMAKNLKIGGIGIISGFIDNQLDWVMEEHKKNGLNPIRILKKDNWHAVVLEKIQ